MKKIISMLLALVLILGVLPLGAFAAEPVKVTLTADKTRVEAGEEITLTLSIDKSVSDAYLWQWNIMWNSELFEAVSMAKGTAYKRSAVNINATTYPPAPYRCSSVTMGNSLNLHELSAGTLCTLTLRAKETITEASSAKFYADYVILETGYEDDNYNIINVPYENVTTDYEWGTSYKTIPDESASALLVSVEPKSEAPATQSYTVTMGTDVSAVVGETVSIPVTVGNTGDASAFNAFDMTFRYDASALELLSTEIEGLTVTTGSGTVRVQGYGADRSVDSTPFTLKFKAIAVGNTDVTITSAKVDISANAVDANAPDALLLDDTTAVAVSGYPVTLPENFTGAAVAMPNEDYTFRAPSDHYDYTVGATVGGTAVDVVDNGDGSYTIPGEKIGGKIEITATKTGKTYSATLGTDMTGNATAQYMKPYSATLNPVKGYTYDVSVTIGGAAYTGYSVSSGVYTIPGEDITGAIVFTVTKTEIPKKNFTVTFEGSGAGDVVGESSVKEDSDYTFTLTKADGYTYTVTAVMGSDKQEVSLSEKDGKYTIAKVSGDIVITVEKTAIVNVELSKFVELDGKTVFLVTVQGVTEEGKAYAYDGTAMYYSKKYQAWCYLVVVDGTFSVEDAKAKITLTQTSFTTIGETKDVNLSEAVDINDAQLVYDIYNGKYTDFTAVSMQKFLNADVNGDKVVNVTDAAAVVAAIA